MIRKLLIGAVIVAAIGVGAVACSDATGDTPITGVDDKGATVLQMPDGFSNVAAKCDGPNRVYVIYHGSGAYGSVDVVKDDPRCTGEP